MQGLKTKLVAQKKSAQAVELIWSEGGDYPIPCP